MKKILAILVVAALMVAFSASALAAGSPVNPVAPAPVVPVGPADPQPELEITPVTDAEKGTTEEDKAIVAAFDEIKDAESLTALIPGLEDVVAAVDPSLKADDLVVSDLFGITASDEAAAVFAKGEKVTFSVKSDLQPGAVLIVVQFIDGEWVVVDPADVVINADGTVSVTVSSAAPIAFLTKGA